MTAKEIIASVVCVTLIIVSYNYADKKVEMDRQAHQDLRSAENAISKTNFDIKSLTVSVEIYEDRIQSALDMLEVEYSKHPEAIRMHQSGLITLGEANKRIRMINWDVQRIGNKMQKDEKRLEDAKKERDDTLPGLEEKLGIALVKLQKAEEWDASIAEMLIGIASVVLVFSVFVLYLVCPPVRFLVLVILGVAALGAIKASHDK
jgi:hypothetical protein